MRLIGGQERQSDFKRRALRSIISQLQAASHQVAKLARDRKPKAGPPEFARITAFDLLEGLKDHIPRLGGYPRPRVADANQQDRPIFGRCG